MAMGIDQSRDENAVEKFNPSQESMASRVVISTTRPSASNESIAERRNPCGVQSKWEEIFRKGVILL